MNGQKNLSRQGMDNGRVSDDRWRPLTPPARAALRCRATQTETFPPCSASQRRACYHAATDPLAVSCTFAHNDTPQVIAMDAKEQ